MKLAVTVYQNKVAPRFDCAEEFLIIDIENNRSREKKTLRCRSDYPLERAIMLAESDVDIVICGAIDQYSSRILSVKGKQVFSWQSGNIEDIIDKFTASRCDTEVPP
jgi:predicted Fe-Mo cluster-binding NifX family protein